MGQHENCTISITNANDTRDSNGEHKFKVRELLSLLRPTNLMKYLQEPRSISCGYHLQVSSFLVTNLHNSSVKWFSHIDQLAETAAATERYLAAKASKSSARDQQVEADGASLSDTAQAAKQNPTNSTGDHGPHLATGGAVRRLRRMQHTMRKQI